MAARHKAKIETPHGLRTCFEARIQRDGQAGAGSTVRRDTPHTRQGARSSPTPSRSRCPIPRKELIHRLRTRRCELCEQRHHGGCPPGRQARQPRQARTGPARVGRPHGQETAQDAHRLPPLPRRTSTRTPSRTRHKSLESPVHSKGARWVRREAARKRPGFTTGNGTSPRSPPCPRSASSPPRSTSTPTSRSSSERSIAPHPSGPPPVDTGRPTPCSPSSTACDYAEERGLSDPLTSTNDDSHR